MNSRPTILITGAAGRTGRHTTLDLLERGFPVRALVHRLDSRSSELASRGAEVIAGSLTDIELLRRAMSGVQRAYFVAPWIAGSLEAATMFAAAAEENRLEAVVAMSQWLSSPAHPSMHTRRTWLADTVFSWMPSVGSITVNPGFFADPYMSALEAGGQFGLFTMPLGNGLNAPPSNQDIARVIAALLADPAEHIGSSYRPTGPELLSPQDIAGVFAEVLGRRVRYVDVPFWMLAKSAASAGYRPYEIAQMRTYFEEYKRDTFAIGAPNNVVKQLTGRDPEGFVQTTRHYADASRTTQRTPSAMTRALAGLVRMTAQPAPRHSRYAAIHEPEHVAGRRLAIDTEQWRDTHAPALALADGVEQHLAA